MVLKEQELLQIDAQFIRKLLKKDPEALAGLSINLANDLKEALERLNQNPQVVLLLGIKASQTTKN